MLGPLLSKTVFADRLSLIRDKIAKYETIFDPDEICKSQCLSFNRVWKYAYENTIFYERWKKDNKLPDQISSLDEIDCFPELTKQDKIPEGNRFDIAEIGRQQSSGVIA